MTEPVNECVSSPKSPNVFEPLLNKTLAVSLTVVKFVIVKFVIVVPLNCAEELIIPLPFISYDELAAFKFATEIEFADAVEINEPEIVANALFCVN